MLSTIGLIIDIAIILAIVVLGIIGFKKGILKTIISLFSWIVCLLIAFWCAKHVAGWINGIYDFSNLIGNNIAKALTKSNDFFAQAINVYEAGGKEALINAIPNETNGLLAQVIKVVFNSNSVDMTSGQTIGSFVGATLGYIAMVVISGLLVFIILKIAVSLLNKLFNKIAQTKVLGGLNKILGLVLGVAKAAFIVIAINCILVALSMVPAVNKTITPIINNNTHVEKFIYNKTDEYFGKYLIEGDILENWINDLWEARK